MISINDDKEKVNEEIMKGIDDVINGRVYDFEVVMEVFHNYLNTCHSVLKDDLENDSNHSMSSRNIIKDKKQIADLLYQLGLINYDFEKSTIMLSKLYFKLALDHGNVDASYYLATICEWEKEANDNKYTQEKIDDLYRIAYENTLDNNIKNLAKEKLNKNKPLTLERQKNQSQD